MRPAVVERSALVLSSLTLTLYRRCAPAGGYGWAMHLPLSDSLAPVRVLESVGSTNAELAARASGAPEFTTTLTTCQTSGRGRLGRTWIAPPGQGLAVSVLLRPAFDRVLWAWLPLIAGLAMARTVSSLLPHRQDVTLKWPNDVLVDSAKISGILLELLPAGAVVIGAGLNLEFTNDTLPTPVSTSLLLSGATLREDALVDAAFSTWFTELRELYAALGANAHDVRDAVNRACGTLGSRVRVELPGGAEMHGVAAEIDALGRLVVRTDAGQEVAVAAGDVTHLRHE